MSVPLCLQVWSDVDGGVSVIEDSKDSASISIWEDEWTEVVDMVKEHRETS